MKHYVLVCALALAACGEDAGTTDTEPVEDTGPPTGVRLLHVSDTIPGGLDMVLRDRTTEDEIRIEGVGQRKASPWVKASAGIYTLLFFKNGTTVVLPELSVDPFDLQDGIAKTVIAGESATGDPRTLQLVDDISVPAENQANLRFLHMAKAGPIDVYNDADGARIVTNITNSQFVPYAQFPATHYDLSVYTEGLRDTLLATGAQLPLPPGSVSTAVLVGDADPNGDGTFTDSAAELLLITDYTF